MNEKSDLAPSSATTREIEQAVDREMRAAESGPWLLQVTQGHRQAAVRMLRANQVSFAVCALVFFATARQEGSLPPQTLNAWLVSAVAMWGWLLTRFRTSDFLDIARLSHSKQLRAVPAIVVLTCAAFWMFTAWLLISNISVGLPPSSIVLAYVLLSVPVVGMFPLIPVPASINLLSVWGSLIFLFTRANNMSAAELTLLCITTTCLVGMCLYIVQGFDFQLRRASRADILVRHLASSNEQLTVLKEALHATMARRATFFAGATHDFRQNLTALKLSLGAALRTLGPSDFSAATLRKASINVDHLDYYATNILNFARIEALDEAPIFQTVELQKLIQDINVRYEDTADELGTSFRCRGTHLTVSADAAMLYRMLDNLVVNALKHAKPGGGVLVAARRRGAAIGLQVWDQGIGIPQDQQTAIFNAFHQEKRSNLDPQALGLFPVGVGLGLTVVQRYADAMGCKVGLRSRVGRGSVFEILIPLFGRPELRDSSRG